MGGHRIQVIPHLDYVELTKRYKACKEPKERSRWLVIRLLSRYNRSMLVEEVATIVGFSPDWVRKIVQGRRQRGEGRAYNNTNNSWDATDNPKSPALSS